jgi:hypothetical protein
MVREEQGGMASWVVGLDKLCIRSEATASPRQLATRMLYSLWEDSCQRLPRQQQPIHQYRQPPRLLIFQT